MTEKAFETEPVRSERTGPSPEPERTSAGGLGGSAGRARAVLQLQRQGGNQMVGRLLGAEPGESASVGSVSAAVEAPAQPAQAEQDTDNAPPLTDASELLEGGLDRVEGNTLFSGPEGDLTSKVPSPATPAKTDADYETAMGIDTAIAAKRMVPVAGVDGKTFTAVGCAGKKAGKVAFTFDRAFVGDYDYAPAGRPVRGVHVSISVKLDGCGEHKDVKLVQILRNIKKDAGKVVTAQPDTEMRKKRSGIDDPKAPSRGWWVDETDTGRSPFYVTSDFYGEHGSSSKAARLRDSPGNWLSGRNIGREFRTCAVSYAGGKGTVLACVDWGYYIDAAGSASFYPASPTASVGAVPEFTHAVERWEKLPGHTKVNLK